MRNFKVWSFILLSSVVVFAWCEKTTDQEKYSCETDDTCPIEINLDTPSIEIMEEPSVIVDYNDELIDEEVENWENFEEPSDQPLMRIVVDENTTAEEVEQDMVSICENANWTWDDWVCTLEDGSIVAF